MEPAIIVALMLLGAFSAALSAVLSSLSQEEINEISELKHKNSERLIALKLRYEDNINSYVILELFLYTLAGGLLGSYIELHFHSIWGLVGSIAVFFIFTIFFRYLFYSLGIRFAERIGLFLTPIMYLVSQTIKPLTQALKLIARNIGGEPPDEASREEIAALVDTAHEEGSLDAGEYRILRNMIHFKDVLVSDVMTPRTVMFACKADTTVEEALTMPELQMYSRFPVWEGDSLDDGIIGYIMSKDVMHAALNGKLEQTLRSLTRKVYFIPENADLDKALEKFLQRRQHLFVVVDEYGGIEGLLTMEDAVETILGVEIVDEADRVVDLRQLAKERRDRRISEQSAGEL
ncbi:MAG: CNNM domain-containing protein [Chloroflexota bacterium]